MDLRNDGKGVNSGEFQVILENSEIIRLINNESLCERFGVRPNLHGIPSEGRINIFRGWSDEETTVWAATDGDLHFRLGLGLICELVAGSKVFLSKEHVETLIGDPNYAQDFLIRCGITKFIIQNCTE